MSLQIVPRAEGAPSRAEWPRHGRPGSTPEAPAPLIARAEVGRQNLRRVERPAGTPAGPCAAGPGAPVGSAEAAVLDRSPRSYRPDPRLDLADAGMSTVEYAVGTVVAAAFAAVLYKIVTGDSVVSGLTALVRSALDTAF